LNVDLLYSAGVYLADKMDAFLGHKRDVQLIVKCAELFACVAHDVQEPASILIKTRGLRAFPMTSETRDLGQI